MTSLPKEIQTMTSFSLRRVGLYGLAAVLAGASVPLLAAPANAAAITGNATGSAQVSLSGASCALTGGPLATPTPVLSLNSDSATPFSASANATGTSNTNAADVTHAEATISGTAFSTETGGSATSVGVDGVASVTFDSKFGLASDCSGAATTGLSGSATLTLTAPAMLDLRVRALHGGYVTTVSVFLASASGASQTVAAYSGTNGRRLALVQPGSYTFNFTLTSLLTGPSPILVPKTRTMPFTFRADFKAPGAAEGASTGTGASYLALPDTLNCSNGTAAADFTAKAGKKVKKPKKGHKKKKPVITKVDFFAGDAKVASVRKPNRDTLTTVTGIDTSGEVTLEAVLSVPKKGTLSVRRTYLPCS
jgi:hypothetical protein